MNSLPRPQTQFVGPVLEFDFPALRIGVAEYDEGPTGCTVFYFPAGAVAAVDARGGSVASFNTERLRMGYDRPTVGAICFAGGATFGLEAVSGVLAELLALRGHDTAWTSIPTVCGAVVYDFRDRDNAIYPDKALGQAALRSAGAGWFPLGAHGAGRFVHAGKFFGHRYMEQAGQGGAYAQIGDTKLAVFTVVNAVGALVDHRGQVVCGNRDPESGMRVPVGDDLRSGAWRAKRRGVGGADGARADQPNDVVESEDTNTTLTLVVTNQQLMYRELQRLAIQTHTSMARAIHPFHTEHDGDLLFAVSTAEVRGSVDAADLTVWASELAWDAVLSSCPAGPNTKL